MTPCNKCGASDRSKSGHCRPCRSSADKAFRKQSGRLCKCGAEVWKRTRSCKPCRTVYDRNRSAQGIRCKCGAPAGRATQCPRCRFENALKNQYGLSLEDYARMYVSQRQQCAICASALKLDKFTHVDHCHSSGRVRGLLCFDCNSTLGHARDSVSRLRAAAEYLQK